jgi:hypothetical protein
MGVSGELSRSEARVSVASVRECSSARSDQRWRRGRALADARVSDTRISDRDDGAIVCWSHDRDGALQYQANQR